MNKQIELFMYAWPEKDPEVKKRYLRKLERLKRGKFIYFEDFAARYCLREE